MESLVKRKLKKKVPQIVQALNGRIRRHHRETLRYSWEQCLERAIGQVESKIDLVLLPYHEEIELIDLYLVLRGILQQLLLLSQEQI